MALGRRRLPDRPAAALGPGRGRRSRRGPCPRYLPQRDRQGHGPLRHLARRGYWQRSVVSARTKRKIRMIKDPPLLKIRKDFARPTSTELAAFANPQTGYVVDAMSGRGALDYRIKPLAPLTATMVGVAITCHCGPADNLGPVCGPCRRPSPATFWLPPPTVLPPLRSPAICSWAWPATLAFWASSPMAWSAIWPAFSASACRFSAPASRPIRRCATVPAPSAFPWSWRRQDRVRRYSARR